MLLLSMRQTIDVLQTMHQKQPSSRPRVRAGYKGLTTTFQAGPSHWPFSSVSLKSSLVPLLAPAVGPFAAAHCLASSLEPSTVVSFSP